MTSKGTPAVAKVSAVTAVTNSDDVLPATVVSNASCVLAVVCIPAVVGVPAVDGVPIVEHSSVRLFLLFLRLCRMGDGRVFLKIYESLSLMKAFRMNLISAGSISLDNIPLKPIFPCSVDSRAHNSFLQPSNPEVRESHKNNGAHGTFLPLYAEIRNSSLTFSVLWKNGG